MPNDSRNMTSANFLDENTTLGKPFFVENGKIIGQRVLSVSPQPQSEFTFVANATIN